jgi:AraC-like DNA-binding protein
VKGKTGDREIAVLSFDRGLWWYRCPSRGKIKISGLIHESSFRIEKVILGLGVGRRTFERAVEGSIGIPAGIWLRQQRAVESRHRLRAGSTVKELAAEYGFRHQWDFSAEFKRWHGVSPSRFRQDIQEF